MSNTKIKNKDITLWLGGTGNFTLDECVEIITLVANGKYEPSQLKQDILFYNKFYS